MARTPGISHMNGTHYDCAITISTYNVSETSDIQYGDCLLLFFDNSHDASFTLKTCINLRNQQSKTVIRFIVPAYAIFYGHRSCRFTCSHISREQLFAYVISKLFHISFPYYSFTLSNFTKSQSQNCLLKKPVLL